MTSFAIATAATELWRQTLRAKSGKRSFICIVQGRVAAATAAGANESRFHILLNAVTLGNTYKVIPTSGEFTLEKTNPFDNPLIEYADGDDLIIQLSGAGAPTLRGLNILIYCISELVAG